MTSACFLCVEEIYLLEVKLEHVGLLAVFYGKLDPPADACKLDEDNDDSHSVISYHPPFLVVLSVNEVSDMQLYILRKMLI